MSPSQPIGCHHAGPWLTLQLYTLQRAKALATSCVQKRSEQGKGAVWSELQGVGLAGFCPRLYQPTAYTSPLNLAAAPVSQGGDGF